MKRIIDPHWQLRGIVVGGCLGIVAVLAAANLLLAAHPERSVAGLEIRGVPPLATEEATTCRRHLDEELIAALRLAHPPGGRVSSSQITACPAALDGLEVTYVGEVVGDVLHRNGGAWVQINDDDYALITGPLVGHRELAGFNTGLAVWLEDLLANRIEAPGRPARRGDVVLVTGVVHQADPADGGGITLRAHTMETLANPVDVEPAVHVPQLVVAIVLSLLAGIGAFDAWQRRRSA